MIRRPPRSTQSRSSAASDVYKRQGEPLLVYIPAGLVHGFYTISPEATVVYRVTSVHDAGCDAGILWRSVDIAWPAASPIVSVRDTALPTLSEFNSPFLYRQEAS